MAIEGNGKVIGSLDDTIVYAELAVNVLNSNLHLYDFRIIEFRYCTLDSATLFFMDMTTIFLVAGILMFNWIKLD